MFSHTIKPAPEDIDIMGHVNNVVYLRYVQEVAEAHWTTKGTKQQQEETLWVVLRHEIDYKKPALQEDTITATTWVDPPEGPKIKRYVELRRAGDNALLAKAVTLWCAIDPATGRPKRLDHQIGEVFGVNK